MMFNKGDLVQYVEDWIPEKTGPIGLVLHSDQIHVFIKWFPMQIRGDKYWMPLSYALRGAPQITIIAKAGEQTMNTSNFNKGDLVCCHHSPSIQGIVVGHCGNYPVIRWLNHISETEIYMPGLHSPIRLIASQQRNNE